MLGAQRLMATLEVRDDASFRVRFTDHMLEKGLVDPEEAEMIKADIERSLLSPQNIRAAQNRRVANFMRNKDNEP